MGFTLEHQRQIEFLRRHGIQADDDGKFLFVDAKGHPDPRKALRDILEQLQEAEKVFSGPPPPPPAP